MSNIINTVFSEGGTLNDTTAKAYYPMSDPLNELWLELEERRNVLVQFRSHPWEFIIEDEFCQYEIPRLTKVVLDPKKLGEFSRENLEQLKLLLDTIDPLDNTETNADNQIAVGPKVIEHKYLSRHEGLIEQLKVATLNGRTITSTKGKLQDV